MENQNPLDPMKTKEMTEQLVQFSQVEQQINQNDKLDELISLRDNAKIKGGLDFVGLKATYKGNQVTFDGQNPVDVTYDLSAEADTAKLNVLNAAGEVVRSKDIDTGAGRHTAQWQGVDDLGNTVESGTYNVRVEAVGADDEPVDTTTFVSGHVDGVETQDGTTKLLIGNQSVSIEDITKARQPDPESGDGSASNS
jgi:flagellar basal-body rod modification protein FlgD